MAATENESTISTVTLYPPFGAYVEGQGIYTGSMEDGVLCFRPVESRDIIGRTEDAQPVLRGGYIMENGPLSSSNGSLATGPRRDQLVQS